MASKKNERRIRVTDGAKTGTIPESRLADYQKNGWTVVDAPQSGEGEEESPADQAANVSRERMEALQDGVTGFERGATLGLDDVVAGGAAAAGDAYQSWADGRPRDPTAYRQGVDERRAQVQAARDRSPTATGVGEVAGALTTAVVPGARILKAPVGKLAKVGRAALTGAAGGAIGGVGDGDSNEWGDAAGDAAGGAAVGALVGGTLGGAALVPGAVGAARRGGWRSLLTAGKKADDALSKASPLVDAAADAVPGVASARKIARRFAPVEEATQSLAPEAELSKDVLQSYLDRLMPKVADDVPVKPSWLRETAAESLDDIAPTPKTSGRALPLEETAEEIARRKALRLFLLED